MGQSRDRKTISKIISIIQLIEGSAMLLLFGLAAIVYVVDEGNTAEFDFAILNIMICFAGLGALQVFLYWKRMKLERTFKKYVVVIANEAPGYIPDIAATLGVSERVFKRNLQRLIDNRYFTDIYIDHSRDRVVVADTEYELHYGEPHSNSEKAKVLLEKASAIYEAGRTHEAISLLNEALQYDPENYLIWNELGVYYWSINGYDQARASYEKALSLKPGAMKVIGNLGVLELYCNNYQLAYQYCKQAYESREKAPEEYAIRTANYALAIAKLGDKEEAMRLLKIAKKQGYENYKNLKRMIEES